MPRTHLSIRAERGQTTAEFAIVLPVFCMLLFAILQFGIVFNNWVTLTDAVRRGARVAAVSRNASDPSGTCVQAIKDSAVDLDQSKLNQSPPTCTSSWSPGADATVCAHYPYSINVIGLVVKSGSLDTCTTERVE